MSDYEKAIKDTYGDKAHVAGSAGIGHVYLNTGNDGDVVDFSFTPEQARRLAKALKKAAKRAEQDAQ